MRLQVTRKPGVLQFMESQRVGHDLGPNDNRIPKQFYALVTETLIISL